MNITFTGIVSWIIALWAAKVFLFSLPYKFSGHPDTQHIFGTIGEWLKGFLGNTVGDSFTNYGAYVIGSAELVTSIILLAPAVIWLLGKTSRVGEKSYRSVLHCAGGLMAAGIMTGAVFFHLASPLGVEVLHDGKSDNGSLFYAAVSILILGLVLFVANFIVYRGEQNQLA
jgi:hypothetical protein